MYRTLSRSFAQGNMLEHNGKKYARVSEILRPFCNFDGIDQEVLSNKASLGTKVHAAIYDSLNGDCPLVCEKSLPYVQSFEKWRTRLNPIFLECEVRYYDDKRMLTGCIDGLIQLHGEKKAILVDYKTSVQESPITWPLQAHLYYYLLQSAGKEISPRFLFLKLDRYGDLPRIFEYKFDANILAHGMQAVDNFWKCVDTK
jgi:hypothetical protein